MQNFILRLRQKTYHIDSKIAEHVEIAKGSVYKILKRARNLLATVNFESVELIY